ncbi:MAG: vitamin K epoxide reductase family protein [Candidatus Microthrix sp.]|nr:vitamin K epoxide reductase family protein [Candidatus Microthrix sp.]
MSAPGEVSPAEPDSPEHGGVHVGRLSALWVLIAGVVGLSSALALTIEKVELLKNPAYVPTCSLNPVLSCGSVMVTPQAAVFGFPNSLIGIVSFTVVLVTGVLAVARVQLPRWYWAGLAVGTLLGTVFVHWLIYQSVFTIGALCLYCMVVWSMTIPLLVVVTTIAVQPQRGNAVLRGLHTWRWSIVALWFTAVILLCLVRFWSYWSTLL